MSVQGLGIQVLETVHIIATTKNIDTIKGRYELLVERIEFLRRAAKDRQYSTDVNASIERYKSMYHDRLLHDFELTAISKPNDFDTESFYCDALVACMKRFAMEQENEINSLKSENAKAKRRSKVVEKMISAKDELQYRCSSSLHYSSAVSSLQQMQTNLQLL